MYQLSLVPVANRVFLFGRKGILGGLEVRAEDSFYFRERRSLVTIEVTNFDVEIAVVVEAVAGNWGCEGHGEALIMLSGEGEQD